jgi:hypothetical protein
VPPAYDANAVRAAARTIYTAATSTRPGNPIDVNQAHNALIAQRLRAVGPTRDALDGYLDEAAWHSGPLALGVAIQRLAITVDRLPAPKVPPQQLQLF